MKKITLLLLFFLIIPSSAIAEEKAPATKAATETPATEPPPLGSETVCEVDIYYSWKPNPPAKKEKEKNPEPVVIAETKVLFQTIGEQGLNEKDIKNKLATKITLTQKQALEECGGLHQDQGQCLTKKIKPQQELLGKMDFATKNALLAATIADCQSEQGSCGKIETSETRCYLNKPEKLNAETPAATNEKAADKPAEKAAEKPAATKKK